MRTVFAGIVCLVLASTACRGADEEIIATFDRQYDNARDSHHQTTYDAAVTDLRAKINGLVRDGHITGTFLQKLASCSRNAPTYLALLDVAPANDAYVAALAVALQAATTWEERDMFAFHLAHVTTTCTNLDVLKLLSDKDESIEASAVKIQISQAFLTSKPQEVETFALAAAKEMRQHVENSPRMDVAEISEKMNHLLFLIRTTDAAESLEENLLRFGSAMDWDAALADIHDLDDPKLYHAFLRKSLLITESPPSAKATMVEILFAHDPEFPHTPNLTSILAQIASELEADGRENESFTQIARQLAHSSP